MDAADAFVFVTPEYNHGYPASLKNAIDYLHHEWRNKPVGFVSYGGVAAGTRSVEQLQQVVTAVKLYPLIEQVNIPFYQQFIDDSGAVNANDVMEQAAGALLDQLVKMEALLRPLREEAARGLTPVARGPALVEGDRRAGERLAVGADQERDDVRDLGGLDQLLDRVRREDHLLEHLLLGEVVRLGLVGDLLLDERRADVAGAYGGGGDPVAGALERERLAQPDDAVLGADVRGFVTGTRPGRGRTRSR